MLSVRRVSNLCALFRACAVWLAACCALSLESRRHVSHCLPAITGDPHAGHVDASLPYVTTIVPGVLPAKKTQGMQTAKRQHCSPPLAWPASACSLTIRYPYAGIFEIGR